MPIPIFKRLCRHLLTTVFAGHQAFPGETLKAIEAAITEGETRHRAEVRLIVEPALSVIEVWNRLSPRQRARALFAHYGIWDTEENCGVLVYVNLADRQVEIVADRGVGRVVAAAQWHEICRTMTAGFAHGDFHNGTLAALERINALLQQHYPDDGSRRNQLSNEPLIL